MTLKEAWHNICVRLTAYANEHGFSEEDVTSEVMVESVICELPDQCTHPKDLLGCWKQFVKHYCWTKMDGGERKSE